MNLCLKYPIVYWNCACLITDSGGTEDTNGKGKTTAYNKIAQAMGKMINEGIQIAPPNINTSSYTFSPDDKNDRILFGLRGITNVGEELIQSIISHRPYTSIPDFLNKVNPNKQAMIALIKGGAFDELCPRYEAMVQYLWLTCDKKKRLTLQNMPGLMKYNIIPDDQEYILPRRIYEFNRYLKSECTGTADSFVLDIRALDFLYEIDKGELIEGHDTTYTMNKKLWDKVYQYYMDVFRDWIIDNKDEILDTLNTAIFMEDWKKYSGKGNLSSWEMEALCFYYHDHELKHVNKSKYGLVDFFQLPEVPVVDKVFKKGGATIPIFKLNKICGTCIAKNKDKATVYLLTDNGVVPVKFRKEYFALFDRQIFQKNENGTKTVVEKSWFNRGNMIMVQGIRRGDEFIPKKYASSGGHQLYYIDDINADGDLILRSERKQGELEEDGDGN